MPEAEPSKIVEFETPNDLEKWLESNHSIESELWVKIFKKKSRIASVTWDEVVVESLCWGWIDGVKKSVDENSYLQRITPRRARSNWSKRNRDHVERLVSDGRMKEAGLIHVNAAKLDGRWERAYSASEMMVPPDFIEALDSNPSAKEFFGTLTKSSHYVIALGLTSAKKLETRQRRFDKYMGMLISKEKPT